MVDRFEDVYEFNIRGNFIRELRELSASIDKARKDWDQLGTSLQKISGSSDSAKRNVRELGTESKKTADSAKQTAQASQELAGSSKTLQDAYKGLLRDQNRLNAARAQELVALQQARRNSQPAIINARAEARALRQLTRALEDKATKQRFAELAAKSGLKTSADGAKLFDAEAVAARRAAEAQERLAVARALAARGLDETGAPLGPQLTPAQQRGQDAQAQINRELESLRLEEARLALEKTNPELLKMRERVAAARKELADLSNVTDKTGGAFNRISFTFRRLIGIMAAFTAARVVVRGFNSMIATAIRFRAQIEQTRVGLAGLIAASAEIRPITGEQVGVDEQLRLSQDIAIEQMQSLRREALQTAASYEELAFAFQTAVAPGLQSGLTLDQIRDVTVDISQAATALGVAQNQLAEEIRSLFQGTITPRNTRIATALGINNEDIQRAKEVGNLAEFLRLRFSAISRQGEKLMDTFTGALSNAGDAFKQLLSEASGPLFLQLKGAIKDVTDAIANVEKNEEPFLDPGAVNALQGLFQGLANGVSAVRVALRSLSQEGLRDVASTLGEGLGLAASVLANGLVAAFNVATPLFGILSQVLRVANNLVTAFGKLVSGTGLGRVALIFAQVLVATRGVSFLFGRLAAVSSGLGAVWSFIRKQIVATATATAASAASTTRLGKAATLVSNSFRKVLLPVLALLVTLNAIDEVTKAFTGKTAGALKFVGDLFGEVNKKFDELVFGADDVEETGTKKTSEGAAQVVNDFRKLRGELAETSRDLDQKLIQSLDDLSLSLQTLGVPQGIAQQVRSLATAEAEFQENTRKAGTELVQLQQRLKAIEGQRFTEQAAQLARGALLVEAERLEELIALRKKERDLIPQVGLKADPLTGGPVVVGDPEDITRRLNATAEIRDLEEKLALVRESAFNATAQAVEIDGKRRSTLDQIALLEKEIFDLKVKQEAITAAQQLAQAQRNIFSSQQQLRLSKAEALAAEAEITALTTGNEARAASLQAAADLARIDAERKNTLEEINAAIQRTTDLQNAEGNSINPDLQLITSLDLQRGLLEDQLEIEKQIFEARRNRARLEQRIADLRNNGNAFFGSGEDPSGFEFGLGNFAAQNASEFNLGERFAENAANGLTSAIGQTVAAAFDPNSNLELSEALGRLALQLGQGLLTDFLRQQLASFLVEEGVGTLAKEGANAVSKGTDLVEAGTELAGAGVSQQLAGSQLQIAANALKAAALALSGSSVTDTAASATKIATAIVATGGQVGKTARTIQSTPAQLAASHRGAQGFALGGRPRGVDPRDTIPAWLRPNEWVIRPEAVAKYGSGFFAALNSMRISPDLFNGISSPVGKTRKLGFATGGPATSPTPRKRNSSSGSPFALQFFDEQVMDRALAAGSQSAVRFARKRRSAYRAALGLDSGAS